MNAGVAVYAAGLRRRTRPPVSPCCCVCRQSATHDRVKDLVSSALVDPCAAAVRWVPSTAAPTPLPPPPCLPPPSAGWPNLIQPLITKEYAE